MENTRTENPAISSTKNSNPTSLGSILQESLGLISGQLETNSSITGNPSASLCVIGKQPSEIVLDSLRNAARKMQQGILLDDQTFEMLLVQHFGSSRLVVHPKLKHVYTEFGYDSEIESYSIALDGLADCEMSIFDAVEFLNKPAKEEFVSHQVARMSVVMARRSESNDDLAILIDTYAQHLREFPADVVKSICDQIIDNEKWFPLVSEMRKRMNALVKLRRAIMQCFEEKRNPLLAKKAEAQRLANDPRSQIAWKELAQKDWLPCHFEWAIGECHDMLKLAEQNPQFLEPEKWREKIADLEKKRAARNFL